MAVMANVAQIDLTVSLMEATVNGDAAEFSADVTLFAPGFSYLNRITFKILEYFHGRWPVTVYSPQDVSDHTDGKVFKYVQNDEIGPVAAKRHLCDLLTENWWEAGITQAGTTSYTLRDENTAAFFGDDHFLANNNLDDDNLGDNNLDDDNLGDGSNGVDNHE